MGFRCPVCHKDFGVDKMKMCECIASHSDEEKNGVKDLFRLNFNDCLENLVQSQIPVIKR